jgi:hypothetical protein
MEGDGEPMLLSLGTPGKTLEPTGAAIDPDGVIHVTSAAGSPVQQLWYTNTARALRGDPVVLGPELGHDVKEYWYPCLVVDGASGRVYISYREHPGGAGKAVMLERGAEGFSPATTFAAQITQRLRWNAPVAITRDGGVAFVWEQAGKVHARRVTAW